MTQSNITSIIFTRVHYTNTEKIKKGVYLRCRWATSFHLLLRGVYCIYYSHVTTNQSMTLSVRPSYVAITPSFVVVDSLRWYSCIFRWLKVGGKTKSDFVGSARFLEYKGKETSVLVSREAVGFVWECFHLHFSTPLSQVTGVYHKWQGGHKCSVTAVNLNHSCFDF
jgi:hypothetical protein